MQQANLCAYMDPTNIQCPITIISSASVNALNLYPRLQYSLSYAVHKASIDNETAIEPQIDLLPEVQLHQKAHRVRQTQILDVFNRTNALTLASNATWPLMSASRRESSEGIEPESSVSQSDGAVENGIDQRTVEDTGKKFQMASHKDRKSGQPVEVFDGNDREEKESSRFSNEYHIKQRILRNYDKTCRPVWNDSTPTTLYVGMSLYHILDTVCINKEYTYLNKYIINTIRYSIRVPPHNHHQHRLPP